MAVLAYILGSTGLLDLSGLVGRQFFQAFQDARFTYLLYSWGGVFGALLTIPYVLAFHAATGEDVGVRSLVTTTAVIGAVLTALGFMKTLTTVYLVAPAAPVRTSDEAATIPETPRAHPLGDLKEIESITKNK